MVESKGWKWEIVEDDKNSIWKNPSVESYYLLNRWKTQNKTEFLDLGCGLGRHSILFGILGIAMIIIGNIMPKLRMNSVVGLKTKWSMKNETTWKKSQHFGGISYIIGGAIVIVICFFSEGMHCFLLAMAIIMILLAIDVFYTYRIAKI